MLYVVYALLYLFIFIFGACIGSFLNVPIYRVPRGISIAKGRSFCPNCKHTLSALDLVPVFSWIILKRKCRYCHNYIPYRYPLVEMLSGILACFGYTMFGFSLYGMVVFATSCILIVIAFIDVDTMEIPNGLVIALIVPTVIAAIVNVDISLLSRIIGFFAISVPMIILNIVIPSSFGGGDIKVIAVCGFLLGWQQTLFAMFVALIFGGIYGIYLLKARKKSKKDHFAFGPFLSIGIITAMYFGNVIICRYLSLFTL